ncbi:MAG: DUF2145 domain-containing protein [Variovorax sp.]
MAMLRLAGAAGAVVLAGLFLFPVKAHAGRSCEQAGLSAAAVEKGMQLAERTAQALDASGARAVLLARAGQDFGKYGLRYSHLGLAYKTDTGAWRVVHKLNHCGTAVAELYRQGLGEFILDDLSMKPATIRTREQAQAWLQFKGYEPTALALGPLSRLGGRVGSANVAFDDHPNEKRLASRIETVTVDSVFAWLQRAGLGGQVVTLKR